jgi:3-phenylpropionate/trans-cinnamate dioxygenase ferredoxin reductase subunit
VTDQRRIVLVGAGLAAAKAAETLRSDGFDGALTMLGQEPVRPYERPALSKSYLRGAGDPDAIFVHSADVARDLDVDLRTSTRAVSLDRGSRTVTTDSGESVPYDRLLLATGARPRRLDLPGADLDGIHSLRTAADARALHDALVPGAMVVVVGAGWIGSEVAASARQLGAEVTIVDPLTVPLERVLGPEVGAVFGDLHVAHGVTHLADTKVEAFLGDGAVRSVRTSSGDLPASVVVVGVGAEPRVELARDAGLRVDDGVEVDEHLRTTDPSVYAAGDIAAAWNPRLQARLRVEHWSNALNQGITAGHNLLGADEVYDRTPTFFSDQYDLGMEYRGHATAWDRVVFRGDPSDGAFCAFWLDRGHVVAAMNVNIWDQGAALDALVRAPGTADAAALADLAVPLDSLIDPTTPRSLT